MLLGLTNDKLKGFDPEIIFTVADRGAKFERTALC